MTTAPPEWFAKALTVLNDVSGWLLFALAATGVIFLCVPFPAGEVDLVQFRREQGGWILVATIFCGLLVLTKLMRHAWKRRTDRRAHKKRETKILAQLDTLPPDEMRILMEYVRQEQRTFGRPGNWLKDEALQRLVAKDLVTFSYMVPLYTIPNFVWDELQMPRHKPPFLR